MIRQRTEKERETICGQEETQWELSASLQGKGKTEVNTT